MPHVSFWATLGGGHDNQILAEPERRGVIEAVADEFTTASGRAQFVWSPRPGVDHLQLAAEGTGTRYGTSTIGTDDDFRLAVQYRRRFGTALMLDGNGSWWRFRRSELDDFNVDMSRGSLRVAWAPSPAWVVSATARANRLGFPDRPIVIDTTFVEGDGEIIIIPLVRETEQDEQVEAAFGLLRRLGRAGHVSLEASYRWSDSNEPSVRYEGPQIQLRLGRSFPGEVALVGMIGFVHRRFEPYEFVPRSGEDPFRETRRDDAWQFGFGIERPVAPGVRLLADGSWFEQRSSLGAFSFDHARFSLAISVELVSVGKSRHGAAVLDAGPPARAPEPSADGVVFRLHDPGAAEVVLVGDFNAWDPGRTPLRRGADGEWIAVVALAPGIWRYAFVVDGRWIRPPDAPRYEPDGFGGENGVLEVPAGPGVGGVTDSPGLRPTKPKDGGAR